MRAETAFNHRRLQLATHWTARKHWTAHLCTELGNPNGQMAMRLPGLPEFLVYEFAPRRSRPYYTYVTAGLSLLAQRPRGAMPHIELVAYCEEQDSRVPELLAYLAYDIATADANEPPYEAGSLWAAPFFGLHDFLLAPAVESRELLDFPNTAKHPEDERFVLAATGSPGATMSVDLLQVIPLTAAEHLVVLTDGSAELLDRLGGPLRNKTHGWPRGGLL